MYKTNKTELLLYMMLVAIVVISMLNVFMLHGRAEKAKEANEIAKEFLKPAKLEVTKILLSDCKECFDIENALEGIKKQNVNVTQEKTLYLNDGESKKFIDKFHIKKIPTLIISGEINKTEQLKSFFNNIGNFFDNKNVVYTSQKPPYYDVPLAKVVGKVSITSIVDSSCKECAQLNSVVNALKQSGVAIEEKTLEYSSQEAMGLIKKFNVGRIPALLISNEVKYYEGINKQLQQVTNETQGFYALHATTAPYRDLKQGKIIGLVKIILLTDNSCNECYEVNINERILQGLGVFVNEEVAYDISSAEGKKLIAEYNIEKVPIVIMSPEAKNYPLLMQAWQSVGTTEKDGWYVMRNPEGLGTYKDLITNKVVMAQQQKAQQ